MGCAIPSGGSNARAMYFSPIRAPGTGSPSLTSTGPTAFAAPPPPRSPASGSDRRKQRYAEIHEVAAGQKPGRTRADERILIHTTGLVSQDVALAHYLFTRAQAEGRGIRLPAARPA